jgi:hypothetical protein
MNEHTQRQHDPSPEARSSTFKGFQEAYKVMRVLQPPISPETKADYLSRVRACPSARHIAFRFLGLLALGDLQPNLGPLSSELDEILHQNEPAIDLRGCDSVEAVRRVIAERFAMISKKDDWKRFFASGSHLPILYAVIRTWDDPSRFQAALDAITVATAPRGKRKRTGADAANNLELLARALLARVPENPGLGTGLLELLKLTQAIFRQADETNRENLQLESAIAAANAEIDTLRKNLTEESATRKTIETEYMQLESHVDELQGTVKEEKEHFATLKAHNEEERKKAIQDAVARVRSDVLMRLENIRLFADRKEPNRQGILNLVREIQDALQANGEKS